VLWGTPGWRGRVRSSGSPRRRLADEHAAVQLLLVVAGRDPGEVDAGGHLHLVEGLGHRGLVVGDLADNADAAIDGRGAVWHLPVGVTDVALGARGQR